MRILVCGGRDYTDYESVRRNLLEACNDDESITIIHGAARGADALAVKFAIDYELGEEPYPANWSRDGKAAGPIRNQQMLSEGKPDLVVAFPGGNGTADMVRRARKAGVEVREIAA